MIRKFEFSAAPLEFGLGEGTMSIDANGTQEPTYPLVPVGYPRMVWCANSHATARVQCLLAANFQH